VDLKEMEEPTWRGQSDEAKAKPNYIELEVAKLFKDWGFVDIVEEACNAEDCDQ